MLPEDVIRRIWPELLQTREDFPKEDCEEDREFVEQARHGLSDTCELPVVP
jgi:hypothetical protein